MKTRRALGPDVEAEGYQEMIRQHRALAAELVENRARCRPAAA